MYSWKIWKHLLVPITLLVILDSGSCLYQSPRIVEHPQDVVVARHQPVTLECRAEGDPPPVIRWYKDGALLPAPGDAGPSQPRRTILPSGGLFFLRTALARKDSDAGTYWCEAINKYGTTRSRNATLQVAVLREEFRFEPIDTRAAAGDTALLECAPPRGSPEPSVAWRKNGHLIDLEASDRISIVDGGNLVIQDLRTSDEGRYQCVAKNAAGLRESDVANLYVHIKPFIITGPEDATVLSGSSVTFECKVGGDPLPDVLWRRTADGGHMPLGRVHILEDRALRLDSVTVEDQGDYICEADNSVGRISVWGTLTVHSIPYVKIKPITQNTEEGKTVQFECTATGYPKPKIYWSIEGNHSLITPGTTTQRYQAVEASDGESTFTLRNVTKYESNSVVICTAINLAGSAMGKARFIVSSESDRPPPVITIGPSNQTLPLKSLAILPCGAEGHPPPVISWYHKNIPVVRTDRIQINDTGTMTIKDLQPEDSGPYTCVAASKNGKSVWTGNLEVDRPTNPNVNFFRGPDVSSLPGTPSRPQIRNQSEDSVTLTWTQNNKIGSSSLLGYQVEMFGKDNTGNVHGSKWVVVAQRLTDTIYTQKALPKGGAYTFLVRAENAHGFSPPSVLSETVIIDTDDDIPLKNSDDSVLAEARASLQSEEIVKLTEGTAGNSTSIKIGWKTLIADHLEGYYVYYRPIDVSNTTSEPYRTNTIVYIRGINQAELNDLKKFTSYEIFLVPYYKKIEGRPSNMKIVKTAEDVPEAAPLDLEASLVNSSTVYLKWKPPPAGTHNGAIVQYNVILQEADDEGKEVIVHNSTVWGLNARIGGLKGGGAYWVKLAAGTLKGIGPYTVPAKLKVPPGAGYSADLFDKNNRNQYDLQSAVSSDLFTETWFLVLLGSMLTIMILLFAAMFFVRRKHLMMKEAPLPNLYDPHSLNKNLSMKSTLGLPPPSANYKQGGNIKTDSLLWVKSRPETWKHDNVEYSQVAVNQSELPEYDKIHHNQMPDYAEVDASMITFRKGGNFEEASSPAAYASVTLVSSPGNPTGSMDWTNRYVSSNLKINEHQDEDLYPASNGGYFNRNVFYDSYFANQNGGKIPQVSRSMDKSNLSLPNDGPVCKESYPQNQQNYFATGKRSTRHLRLVTGGDPNIRMQENPTFGLDDYSNSVQPMKILNHQYARSPNPRTSPMGNGVPLFASFKSKNRNDTEYHASTMSEPCNNL